MSPSLPSVAGALRRLAGAALALHLAAASAAPLDDMRRQVEASQFDQAWATAQANPQLIGDVHFDFLYGVAALNTGHVADGVLALERHLSAVPANDRARLELARGYFLLGEYTRARAEFEFVLRYNPPAGVRASIAGYLQAMQQREAGDNRATARVYAEAGMGHDSNVNGGTWRDNVDLGTFGNVSLDGSPSRQVADDFVQAAVGGQQLMRVSNAMSVFAGADLDQRSNLRQHAYDLSTVGAYAGLSQLAAGALWRLTLGGNELLVGGHRYRDTLAGNAEASFNLGPQLAVQAFAQYAETRYATSAESLDARTTTLGALVNYSFEGAAWAPGIGARLSWTQEQNLRLRDDLGYELPLLRVFASVSPVGPLRVTFGLTAFKRRYGGTDLGFQTVRSDRQLGADLVLAWALDARWSLRADLLWSDTRSNQHLYDSRRNSAVFKLRYQF